MASLIPPAEALLLHSLVNSTEQGIASRVLAKTGGGNLTLFAFDAGQGLSEHTSPFEAFSPLKRRSAGSRQALRSLRQRSIGSTARCGEPFAGPTPVLPGRSGIVISV